jgi:hypothetical protein
MAVKRYANLIDSATLRRVAVEAGCDPRTIRAVLAGETTAGLAFERAKAALERAGFKVPASSSNGESSS